MCWHSGAWRHNYFACDNTNLWFLLHRLNQAHNLFHAGRLVVCGVGTGGGTLTLAAICAAFRARQAI